MSTCRHAHPSCCSWRTSFGTSTLCCVASGSFPFLDRLRRYPQCARATVISMYVGVTDEVGPSVTQYPLSSSTQLSLSLLMPVGALLKRGCALRHFSLRQAKPQPMPDLEDNEPRRHRLSDIARWPPRLRTPAHAFSRSHFALPHSRSG